MNLDWATIFMLWTPISAALFCLFLLLVLLAGILLYVFRQAVAAWFLARTQEKSTGHAINVAVSSTSIWLLDLAGAIPDGQHVPFVVVKCMWLIAFALFIKPDAGGNPQPAAPAA